MVVKLFIIVILKFKVVFVYLFMGLCGIGKIFIVCVFVMGLNCFLFDFIICFCGICCECGIMVLNWSVDVCYIDVIENVDFVSMCVMMVSFIFIYVCYKVFIVEGCDVLSVEIWNLFLKMLEEFLYDVVFVFIIIDVECFFVIVILWC